MADKLLGSFVWCELLTTDSTAAQSFYKKVVGWTAVPFAPDGSYNVFNNASGAGVAGVMKLPDAAKQMGAPPNWMMYVGTPSVDDTAVRIASLGGRVLRQPDDIPGTGRFAVVQDPFGAVFGIFQPPSSPFTANGNATASNTTTKPHSIERRMAGTSRGPKNRRPIQPTRVSGPLQPCRPLARGGVCYFDSGPAPARIGGTSISRTTRKPSAEFEYRTE